MVRFLIFNLCDRGFDYLSLREWNWMIPIVVTIEEIKININFKNNLLPSECRFIFGWYQFHGVIDTESIETQLRHKIKLVFGEEIFIQ